MTDFKVKGNSMRALISDILKSKKIQLFIIVLFAAPLLLELMVYLITYDILFFAGEILLYYGSLIAFIGTVLLALVAWKQNIAAAETNQRLADANDKLVALAEKMQDIQMAENKAVFSVSNQDAANIILINNKYTVDLDIDFNLISGYGWHILLKSEDVMVSEYEPSDIVQEMYMSKRIKACKPSYFAQNISVNKPINMYETDSTVILCHYIQELSINNELEIDKNDLDSSKSLIIKFFLNHWDIYNNKHSENLYVVYRINHADQSVEYFSCYTESI